MTALDLLARTPREKKNNRSNGIKRVFGIEMRRKW